MGKRSAPEVNAGSMADIAFLLLIFFLVATTIEQDNGVVRKLPPKQEDEQDIVLKQKNVFTVIVNSEGELLVEDEPMDLKDLRVAAKDFIDNGGGKNAEGETCNYCKGKKDPESSDHPDKAIISLQNDRQTKYDVYLAIQGELGAAYTELRNRESMRLYKVSYEDMDAKVKDANYKGDKEKLKERIKVLKEMYPQFISEADKK